MTQFFLKGHIYYKNSYFLTLFFLFFFGSITAQITISGKITSKNNEPLIGASVYFNNTTIGTISDKNGKFDLKIKEGSYTLVVSFLGFKTQQIAINTSNKQSFFNIQLKEEENVLDEVEIVKTKYDGEWKYNLARFKQSFLGRSILAKECRILNEKELHFDFNAKTNTLTAIARSPLKIKHSGLGYLILYDLENFTLQQNQLFFSGYAQYKNLRKSIRKKWRSNRIKAYKGSQMHFFRTLLANQVKEEGFVVNQFKRVLNPERPTDEQIKMARQLIRLHGNKINFSKKISEPKTPLDSALVISRKASLPKYRDYLYKRNVPYKEMISFENGIPFVDFENYLMVIYTKEIEEENYLKRMFGRRKKPSGVQTSNTVLRNGKAILDKTGITVNPNALFNEGYWAFEAFGDMLPLDYQLPKE